MDGASFKSTRSGKKSKQRSKTIGVRPGPDFWTPSRDNEVRDTGGRYRDIGKLADAWGIGSAVIVARWHKLRVE